MPRRTWTLVVACMGVASSLVVAAWGHDTTPTSVGSPLGVSPNLVSADDVRMAAPGSPERAVLVWARAVQRSRTQTVLRMYTPSAVKRGDASQIDRAVRGVGELLGRPVVVQTGLLGFGPRVRLRVLLVSYDEARQPVHVQPLTVYLRFGPKGWRLDDARYLLDSYLEVERANRRRAEADGQPA